MLFSQVNTACLTCFGQYLVSSICLCTIRVNVLLGPQCTVGEVDNLADFRGSRDCSQSFYRWCTVHSSPGPSVASCPEQIHLLKKRDNNSN